MMKRFVIQRDIPAIGTMTTAEFQAAEEKSNAALKKLAPRVQWEHNYVAGDKTFCIYRAEDETAIHDHARLCGLPDSWVTPIAGMLYQEYDT